MLQARSELDEGKRKALYRTLAVTVRDEGGLILPVFNDYVMAQSKNVKGYVDDIGNDMSNGYIGSRVWLDAQASAEQLQALLAAAQPSLRERALATLINDPAFEGPDCLTPA